MIEIIQREIDTSALLAHVQSPLAGAVVLFMGTTREITGERETASLDYECYPEMAEQKLAELEQQAHAKWELISTAIVHRVGHVAIGEASVVVAVSSAHRVAAFEAGKWLIDTLKESVPIWKKENWKDGTCEWVHPGLEPGVQSSPPSEAGGPATEDGGR